MSRISSPLDFWLVFPSATTWLRRLAMEMHARHTREPGATRNGRGRRGRLRRASGSAGVGQ
eukprot:2139283-Pyramimonas_sp.AAC.1